MKLALSISTESEKSIKRRSLQKSVRKASTGLAITGIANSLLRLFGDAYNYVPIV